MKKVNLLPFAFFAMLSCVACQQEPLIEDASFDDSPITTIDASVETVEDPEAPETKSTLDYSGLFTWESDDVISFWPSSGDVLPGDTPTCVKFKVAQGGSSTATFVGSGWALKRSSTYYASMPFNSSDKYNKVSLNYSGQSQAANDDDSHLGAYDYLHAYFTTPATGNSSITFERIGTIAKFVLTIPDGLAAKSFTSLTLSCDDAVFPTDVYYDPSKSAVTLSKASMSKKFIISLNGSEGVKATDGILTVYAMMPQIAWSGKTITAILTDGNGHEFSGTFTPKSNQAANKKLKYSVSIIDPDYTPVPEMVDLGLPSGLKWASFNLGATKPEEYGGYYQWGGLQDVTDTGIYLDWSNCPYHTGTDEETNWTKYVPSNMSSYWSGPGAPDNKTVLEPEDDVAHVTLGDKWRIPTSGDCIELLFNCDSEWTTMNGVEGRMFTSKKNGNSIFLPAAGVRNDRNFYYYDSIDYETLGCYWSSRIIPFYTYSAYILRFDSSSEGLIDDGFRQAGCPIRPVYGNLIEPTGITLDKTSLSLVIQEGVMLTASTTPSNSDPSFEWSSSDNSVAMVSEYGFVRAISGGTAVITASWAGDSTIKATCTVSVRDPSFAVPDKVDLGLPSGLKWASFNIGATKPEEYGGYYQWAGLQDVTNTIIYLDWDNCPYHIGSSYLTTDWMKYIPSNLSSYWSGPGAPDNKTFLDLHDDIASRTIGGSWRMPTEAEFQELIDNCTSEWTKLSGMNGRKFTSKKNGNSIFLPAAGYRYYDRLYYVGSYGSYWSSSLNTVRPDSAYFMYFDSGNVSTSYYDRCGGQSVRPVSE